MAKQQKDQPAIPTEGGIGLRRIPKQPRSRMTVDSILQAAATIVEEEGYQSASTNRIAEKAGVNINSLYQYFTNRESIMRAIYENAIAKSTDKLRTTLIDNINNPPEKALPVLVDKFLSIIEENALIFVYMVDEVPELRDSMNNLSLENLAHNTSLIYLQQHSEDIGEKDGEITLFFMQNCVISNIKNYIRNKPPRLSRKRFIKELSLLLAAYLRSS